MICSGTRRIRAAALWLSVIILAGCAGGIPEPTPADIPRLEQAASANPQDIDTRTQLGIAYYKADRFDEARTTLGRAVDDGADSGAAHLYLGMANEALGNWEGARDAYSSYIDVGKWDPLKDELERRLVWIVRQQLQERARAALDQESQLATAPPQPRTVAVFPFQLISDNRDLEPLQVAMADMVITDLAISNALTVLERTQIQALLDEMALTEAGFTDAGSGARAGRLLRAEHVVQGAMTTLGDANLRFDATLRNTVSASSAGDVTAEDLLEQIFDLEKQIVFQVLDILNVQLTPAEIEAINENRAANLLAFLAYGRGLMAMDRGDFQTAQQFFQQAANLDSGFDAATSRVTEASNLQDATGRSLGDLEVAGAPELGGGLVGVGDATAAGNLNDLVSRMSDNINPSRTTDIVDQGSASEATEGRQGTERDPTQEATGQETSTGTTGTIRVTIRRPGGGS